ncbi:unnamed protein product [Ectocarpus sp. 8 AP-2014]
MWTLLHVRGLVRGVREVAALRWGGNLRNLPGGALLRLLGPSIPLVLTTARIRRNSSGRMQAVREDMTPADARMLIGVPAGVASGWLVGSFPTKPPHVLRCFFRAVCPTLLISCFL